MADSLNQHLELSFDDGIDDLLSRTPVLANTAQELRARYRRERVFGATLITVNSMLQRIRQRIAEGLAQGDSPADVEEAIQDEAPQMGNWYAQTVARTNINTAYTEGRIAQAKRFSGFIVGLEFDAINDAQTRDSHEICDGMRAPTDDEVWTLMRPPLDYNCRCQVITLTRPEAQGIEGALNENGRLRRWHPTLGYDFRTSALLGLMRSAGKGELPNFVQDRA